MDDTIDRKTVYFSHPIAHYNTEFEWECIETIIMMLTPVGEDPTDGYIHIMNPNQKWLQNLYVTRRESGDDNPFEIFREIAISCDIVVGVTFFDGAIGAGVFEECRVALENNKDVYMIFINNGRKLFMPVTYNMSSYKVLSRKDTRQKTKDEVM
jgi:hypothetical protein